MFDLQTLSRRNHVLTLAGNGENSLAVSGDEWDKNPFLLGCKNGVIDLKTGGFGNGNPEDYIRMAVPTEWKGIDESAPQWGEFLKGMFSGDDDLVAYCQRLLGYGITGSTKDHIIAVFWGPYGRNGKGTLFGALRHILGPIIEPIDVSMLTGDQRNRSSAAPSPDIMSLQGRRLVWANEAEDSHQFALGKIKWLTGADTLTGRPPFGKRNISFSPTHKIFLTTNPRPQLSSIDRAFLERLHLIHLKLSFVENPQESYQIKCDTDLPEKLKTEVSGILAWLVRGCLEWQKGGLRPPASVLETKEQYQADEDIIGQFLGDCTRKEPNGTVRARVLYLTYKSWCEGGGYKYFSEKEFGKRMKEHDGKEHSGKGSDAHGNFYKGLSLIVYTQQDNTGGADYA
jgi:putative DNA primase/helicase